MDNVVIRQAIACATRAAPALFLGFIATPCFTQVYGPTLNPRPVPGSAGGGVVTMDDYPPTSLKNGEEGTAIVSLDINEDGSVGHCVVTQSTGYPVLDEASCALIRRRARYVPAKDDAGRPIKSRKDGLKVTWRLPGH